MSSRVAITHSVGETLVHIINPVARQVLYYIVERLGYSELFRETGSIDVLSEFTSTSKAVNKDGNAVIHANRVRAKVNPNVNPNTNKWEGNGTTIDLGNGNHLQITNPGARNSARAAWQVNSIASYQYSVFNDHESDIDIVEHVVGSSFSMEVQVDFMSPTTAAECLGRIFQCFQNGDLVGYVTAQYDYPVPTPVINTLQYLYSLKKLKDKSCLEWLKEKSNGAMTSLRNRNKYDASELVINRNPGDVIYQIECSQEYPTPAQPDGGIVNFTVTVQFPRVNRISLLYPIIVNNQYVDFDYIPVEPQFRLGGISSPEMWQNASYTRYWKSLQESRNPIMAHYPWWDEWVFPSNSVLAQRGFRGVVSVAFTLDDADNPDGETVIDLVDGLPAFRLNNLIVQEIALKRNEVLTPNRYVNIAVFADDYQVGSNIQLEDNVKPLLDLSDGRNLHIRCRRPNTVYRLVISVNPNPANMTSRPLSYDVYPSRFVDLTKAIFSPTKDRIINDDKQYFYYDEEQNKFILVETTPGVSTYDYLAQIPSGVLYERTPPDFKKADESTENTDPQITPLGAKGKLPALRAGEIDTDDPTGTETNPQQTAEDDIVDDPTKLYPLPEEPIETASSVNQNYVDSYKGRNVNNVILATITVRRRKD